MAREGYIGVLEDLIEINTSVPPGKNYELAIAYLEPKFQQVDCQTQVIEIPKDLVIGRGLKGPRVNLLAHRPAPGKPPLKIYCHIDTVPFLGWDGLKPRLENGKLYGRGAADMKGAIVGLLLGLAKIGKRVPAWDLTVMITTDEEMLGLQAPQLEYLGQFLEPLKGAYIWDLDCAADHVEVASLGAIQMELEVRGKSVHSALSHRGENAVEKAWLLMEALLKLKEQVVQRKSRIPVQPSSNIESGKMEARLNVNVIQGGFKTNVVPETCRLSLDRRLIPEEDLAEAEAEILHCLSRVEKVNWKVRNVTKVPPYATDPEDLVINQMARILKEVTGQTGKYGGMGSSDLPGMAAKWGAKVFGLGVFRPENNIHGKDEFISLQDVEMLGEVVAKFLLSET